MTMWHALVLSCEPSFFSIIHAQCPTIHGVSYAYCGCMMPTVLPPPMHGVIVCVFSVAYRY